MSNQGFVKNILLLSITGIISCLLLYHFVDLPLAIYLHTLNLGETVPSLRWLTNFGAGEIYLVIFVGAALFYRLVVKNSLLEARFWFLSLYIMFTAVICLILKISLGRARPSLWFDYQQWGFYGLQTDSRYWSFPSGHTTNIFSITIALFILFPRYKIPLFFTGLIIAASRVLLTYHYFSDVVSAAFLTILELYVLYFYLEKNKWLLPKLNLPQL